MEAVIWVSNYNDQGDVPMGLNGLVVLGDSGAHCLALRSDGTVVAWGQNSSGQAAVSQNFTEIVAVAAGW
jgi:trimeric autotransporter adhesin